MYSKNAYLMKSKFLVKLLYAIPEVICNQYITDVVTSHNTQFIVIPNQRHYISRGITLLNR